MRRPQIHLRLLLSEWRRWPLLEKLKLGGQYVNIVIAIRGVMIAATALMLNALRRPDAPVKVQVARASSIASLSTSEFEELEDADRARFEDLEADEATVKRLRFLLRDIERMLEARELLNELRKTATSRKQLHAIDGFITTTYYERGEHLEGLEFLAQATREVPLDDFRYRWQFHAHIRELAQERGNAEAERVVDLFVRRTHRPELSRVWIGVPHSLMIILRAGETAYGREASEKDVAYLLALTRTHADDRFIDHAHYVLGAYDVVLSSHPASLLRDAALRAAIYRAVDCGQDRNRCDIATARRLLAILEEEFPEFGYPTGKKAGQLLSEAGRLVDAESFACPHDACDPEERWQMLDSALRSPHVAFGEILAWLAPRDIALLQENLDRAFELSDESLEFAARQDYAGAAAILEDYESRLEQRSLTAPWLLEDRLSGYGDLADWPRPQTAEEFFRYGLAEMRAVRRTDSRRLAELFRRNAARTFELAEKAGPKSEWAPKSCYLRAAAFRKLQEYDRANEVAGHFLETHHGSPLYDDMLAEAGWYLLRVQDDAGAAERVFTEVARRFPHGNAADNALTLLAESKWDQCRFAEALGVYQHIASSYPRSRLGMRAQQNARLLSSIVRTRRVMPGVRGLQFRWTFDDELVVASVRRHSDAEKYGFLDGDRILTVGDAHVAKLASFRAAMAAQQIGSTIVMRIESRDGTTRFLRVRVGTVEAYDPDRVTSDCRS